MSFSLRVAFILLSIGLSAQRAKALRVSLARELTIFCTELEGASRGISLTELVILFTTATIWLVAGTYVLLLITEGRDSPVVRSLHRNTPSRLRHLRALSIAAISWLVAGTYVLPVITEARASAVVRSLHRKALSRLRHLRALSPLTTFGRTGRAGFVSRRIPARRGGLAYPMSASRTRWYSSQRRSDVLPL